MAGRDLSKTKAFAEKFLIPRVYTSYEDLASDPDIGKKYLSLVPPFSHVASTPLTYMTAEVVYVGTFNISHYEVTKLMLNHDKHVLCEKPITLLLRHTEELYALARHKKCFLMEASCSNLVLQTEPVYIG